MTASDDGQGSAGQHPEEAPSAPAPAAPAPAAPAPGAHRLTGGSLTGGGLTGGRARGRRRAFRMWRRSRPFWGGLLLILAGLEMVAIPLLSVLAHTSVKVVIYIGIGGVFGVLIGGLLVACGLLVWFHPAQRVFYAIAGVLLAVVSFIATNLGGFFVGMLLGVTGGSLSFGWAPVAGGQRPGRPRRPPREDDPSDGLDVVIRNAAPADTPPGDTPPGDTPPGDTPPGDTPPGDTPPGDTPPGDTATSTHPGRSGPSGRLTALAITPLVLSGLVLPGYLGGPTRPAASQIVCIIPIPFICPAPSPTPSPPASAAPSPAASTAPSTVQPTVTGPSGPAASASAQPSPSASASAQARAAAAPGQLASAAQSSLTADSALLEGLSYDGVAHVPTAAGTVTMMKFTMTSLTLTGDIALTVSEGGGTAVTRSTSMHFGGPVVLYATKLSGDLLGIPVTITPTSPLATILKLLAPVTQAVPVPMTNVVTDQPYTTAGSMQASSLQIGV
jgi:hypothetical protein